MDEDDDVLVFVPDLESFSDGKEVEVDEEAEAEDAAAAGAGVPAFFPFMKSSTYGEENRKLTKTSTASLYNE